MRFLTKLFAAATFSLMAATAGATPANPQNGVDYKTLEKAQPTESGNKVEVIEFFWYSCPHCHSFEPALSEWVKKQGDKIAFKRVPAIFRESMEPQQRLYYALEAMGKAEDMQKKIFRAIHVERQQLDTKEQIVDFVAKQGLDKQKFLDLYSSFGVQTKINRVPQLQQDYRLEGVPTIAIAGRYVTSPSIISNGNGGKLPETDLHELTVKVMDHLITLAGVSQKPAASASAASADKKKK